MARHQTEKRPWPSPITRSKNGSARLPRRNSRKKRTPASVRSARPPSPIQAPPAKPLRTISSHPPADPSLSPGVGRQAPLRHCCQVTGSHEAAGKVALRTSSAATFPVRCSAMAWSTRSTCALPTSWRLRQLRGRCHDRPFPSETRVANVFTTRRKLRHTTTSAPVIQRCGSDSSCADHPTRLIKHGQARRRQRQRSRSREESVRRAGPT